MNAEIFIKHCHCIDGKTIQTFSTCPKLPSVFLLKVIDSHPENYIGDIEL